jgi:hypothetical protein
MAGDDKAVYAYVREKAGQKSAGCFKLISGGANDINKRQKTFWQPVQSLHGNKEAVSAKPWNIEPWGYVVYEY